MPVLRECLASPVGRACGATRPIAISSASCASISNRRRRSFARRAALRRRPRGWRGCAWAAFPRRWRRCATSAAAVARRPADRCADRSARPGAMSRVHGDGGADAVDRHRGHRGGRHRDERPALPTPAGARPRRARGRDAARRAHLGLPARTVLSRVPRLPGAQRRLRRSGRAHPGGRAAVDRTVARRSRSGSSTSATTTSMFCS